MMYSSSRWGGPLPEAGGNIKLSPGAQRNNDVKVELLNLT
jgi:hypothetical protein